MADPVTQLTEPVKEELGRRMKSSFYASWVIAFVAWNWRTCLYLVYPEETWKVRDRILWLSKYVYDEGWFLPTVTYPLVSAAFVVAVFPWITDFLEDVRYRASILQSNRRLNQERFRIPTAKKIIELNELIKERERLLQEEQNKVKELTADIAQREQKHQEALANEDRKRLASVTQALTGLQTLIKHDPQVRQSLKRIRQGGQPTTQALRQILEEGNFIRLEGARYVLTEVGEAAASEVGV